LQWVAVFNGMGAELPLLDCTAIITRKRGNCECIATWSRLSHALFRIRVWSCSIYSLPYYSVFAVAALLYDVTFTSDPVTLTFIYDHEHFAMYRLWRNETLYQIWTQSSNPRRSYCDFNIWPNDLEHVLSVALGSSIIFTKFDIRQPIRTWIIANTLRHAVTLT